MQTPFEDIFSMVGANLRYTHQRATAMCQLGSSLSCHMSHHHYLLLELAADAVVVLGLINV